MDTPTEARPVGRPRTRPAGAKKRGVYLTDDEFAAVQAAAESAGKVAEQWQREQILAALTPRNPRRK